jgi:hypothetical protein
MKDLKLDQIRPLSGRTALERPHGPGAKPAGDFGKALEIAQANAPAPDMAALKDKTRAVIENFEKDAAQFNELMKASQNQAKLIQSMMNRKPDSEA